MLGGSDNLSRCNVAVRQIIELYPDMARLRASVHPQVSHTSCPIFQLFCKQPSDQHLSKSAALLYCNNDLRDAFQCISVHCAA